MIQSNIKAVAVLESTKAVNMDKKSFNAQTKWTVQNPSLQKVN